MGPQPLPFSLLPTQQVKAGKAQVTLLWNQVMGYGEDFALRKDMEFSLLSSLHKTKKPILPKGKQRLHM